MLMSTILTAALARPEAPSEVCRWLPEAADCRRAVPTCDTCHESTDPVVWNAYGVELLDAMDLSLGYSRALGQAMSDTQAADADADGVSNIAELMAGTPPGDPAERWCEADGIAAPDWDVRRAYTRVSSLFCGTRPDYVSMAQFELLSATAKYTAVHEQLDACLLGDWWRDIALPRLADEKIRPVFVYGPDSPADVALANYAWDYRLFTWVLTGDRDAREMLLAQYHVDRDSDGQLFPIEGVVEGRIEPQPFGFPGGQPLEPERRAGMLTAQWFLVYNTFLSDLPRGTAAQAYRSFLDLDIARLEGIRPVDGEPQDLDDRGVDAPACAQCHSTLDPLTYAFMSYEGVPGGPGLEPGVYNPNRPYRVVDDWQEPVSTILGQEVTDVQQWADVAANSDAFTGMLGSMFFRYTHDREVSAHERSALDQCEEQLPEQGYSANALLHCIADLPSFTSGGAR